MGQSHLLTPVAFPFPGTVVDVSPPRNDDEQGDTGSCLIPLVGWGPSRTTGTSQGWGPPGGLWGHSCWAALLQQLAVPVPSPPPQGSDSSICDGGAGWPHKASGSWCGRDSRVMRGLWRMAGVSWVLSQWDGQNGCSSTATSSDFLVNFQGTPSEWGSLCSHLYGSWPAAGPRTALPEAQGTAVMGTPGLCQEQGGCVRGGCSEAPSSCLPSAAWGCEVHRNAPLHGLCVEEAGAHAADHPSGVTYPGTHTQGRSETGVSNKKALKKPHASATFHTAIQRAFAVALAVITLQPKQEMQSPFGLIAF